MPHQNNNKTLERVQDINISQESRKAREKKKAKLELEGKVLTNIEEVN